MCKTFHNSRIAPMKIFLLALTLYLFLTVFTSACRAQGCIEACAPEVAPQTLEAIIGVESRGDPLAIHVNSKERVIFPKPRNREQAVKIANRLIAAGYSVDCGLMQVNSQHLSPGGVTTADLFDPCKNIQVGAKILTRDYTTAESIYKPGQRALFAALSAYNTGDFESGFYNGYVAKYLHSFKTSPFGSMDGLRNPFSAGTAVRLLAQNEHTIDPYGADTSVDFNVGEKKPKGNDAKDKKGNGLVVLKRIPSPYAAPTAVHLSFPKKEKNDVSKTKK